MKVQCQCGAKYAIDVTPEMAHDPVRFTCPGCGVDLSGPINDLVRQELGLQPVAAAPAPAAAPVRIAAAPAPIQVPPAPAAPAPAAPARLSISRPASTATHGTPTAAPAGAEAEPGAPQSCAKHRGE